VTFTLVLLYTPTYLTLVGIPDQMVKCDRQRYFFLTLTSEFCGSPIGSFSMQAIKKP